MTPRVLTLAVLGVVALVASLISVAMYWLDKRAAAGGRRRIPESRLLAIDALGGWPGGALARRVFRHKTAKASFRMKWYLSVSAHVLASAGVLWVISR